MMGPPGTAQLSVLIVVVNVLARSCCFNNVAKRSLTPPPAAFGSLVREQKVMLVINCTNSDVASSLRDTSQVIFYLWSCHVNVDTGCGNSEEKVVAVLGTDLNQTVLERDQQGWVDRVGFPHYMLLHLTLPMADVGRCFTCRKLYNFAFPEEEVWHNTSALCLTFDPVALQFSAQVSALSIKVSSSSPVSFTDRTDWQECAKEKRAAFNTELLTAILCFAVLLVVAAVVAGAGFYWVHRRRRPSGVTQEPDFQPLGKTVGEEKDNEDNSCIDLHKGDTGSRLDACVSYRPNYQPPATVPLTQAAQDTGDGNGACCRLSVDIAVLQK